MAVPGIEPFLPLDKPHRIISRSIASQEAISESIEGAANDGIPYIVHQGADKAQVVNRCQSVG